MHELSIVTHVAKTLDEVAIENNLKKIGSVTLEVGEVSGIITDYFEDCWNYFKVKHPILEESVLKIEIVDEFSSSSLNGALNVTSILLSSINLASFGIGILFIISKTFFISIFFKIKD